MPRRFKVLSARNPVSRSSCLTQNEDTQILMGEKIPVRIYLKEEVIEALKEAAENQTDEMTYNEIASEIVTLGLPLWLQARRAFRDAMDDFGEFFSRAASEAKTRQKPK